MRKAASKSGDRVMVARPSIQKAGGGSIPTSPHQLRIYPIEKHEAKSAYALWHYLGHKGFLASYNYGVFFGAKLVGSISYGIPNAKNIKGLYTQKTQGEFVELTRLALSPDCPKNSESRVIGVTLRMIKKRGYKGVITYADTAQGHTGVIYRATNFDYRGLTAQKTDLWIDGKPVGKLKGVKFSELKGIWVKRSRKHLFVMIFDNKGKSIV